MKGSYNIVKLQSVQEKIIRYRQILKYYGVKATWAYYLGNQSESKYFDYRRKLIKTFVRRLREEAQIDESSSIKKEVTKKFPKIIWTMWQQGESQMPETVKASMKTIKDFAKRNGCEFHLLTDENLHSYITISKDIIEKYKEKKLKAAHYSDIVRFSLLYQYGGIWMDATLFVSPYATLEMFEEEFFSLNHPPLDTNKMERTICDYKWSGYFLAGQKKDLILNIFVIYIFIMFVNTLFFFII